MRVSVDPDGCMGHGMCQALAPEVYEINEISGVNEMGDFEADPGLEAAVARGAAACPERAIAILSGAA